MSYRNFQKTRWNSLASEFGNTKPLRAVISKDSDEINYYFDKTSKRILDRSLHIAGKRVLDMGCGIGRLSVWVARNASHVTGLDLSEGMVRVARNAARSQGWHNIFFCVFDGTVIPFRDSSFEVV